MNEDDIEHILKDVYDEVKKAETKHPPMNSPHEGWAVLFEEVDELWEHVRADTGRSEEARKEAIQVAAMGVRYILNLCK